MTVKILPADHSKITRIQEMIGYGLNVERILEKIGEA